MRFTIVCLLLSAVAISADLQSDLDEISSHFPVEEVVQMGQKYVAAYPSSRKTLQQVQSLSSESILNNLLKKQEVLDVMSYLNQHDVDGESLLRYFIESTQYIYGKILEPQTPGQIKSAKPEITGNVMADLSAIIASSDVVSFAIEKMNSSPDFANYVAAVNDPEFRKLAQRALYSGAFFFSNIKTQRKWSWQITFGK